jgi:four helix bundle protein
MVIITSFKDLLIWRKGIDITLLIYKIVKDFPDDELFALSTQLKRAAVSVPSNIAEGYGRNSKKSFHHFLNISRGSLYEIETQLHIAAELKYISSEILLNEILQLIEEEAKMINSFAKTLIMK